MLKADFVGRPLIILDGNAATGGECFKCYSHSSYFAEIPDKYQTTENGLLKLDSKGNPIETELYQDYVDKWGKPKLDINGNPINNSLPNLIIPKDKPQEGHYEINPF